VADATAGRETSAQTAQTAQRGHACRPWSARSLRLAYLEIFREVVLPVIEDEVNAGTHFAPLRPVYYCS
jgi:hypothetical protein